MGSSRNDKRQLGEVVTISRSPENLPQSTTSSLFTISGDVEIISIRGQVTTAIQAQANNAKLGFDAGGGSIDICTNLDINGDVQNSFYSITGTVTDALINATTPPNVLPEPLVLSTGDIDFTCSASSTGQIAWRVTYRALEDGAAITTA